MGDIVGSLFGGGIQASYDKQAAQTALTGFNWLKNNPEFQSYLANGSQANSQIGALLGLGGNTAGAQNAFHNYLNSTGYNFQLQQGQNAISGSAAAKGLLNSGATAKALTQYGQNLGAGYFNNYLNQLGGLSTQGLQAGTATGEAGTQGGATAAQAIAGEGQAWSQGINGALGGLSNLFGFLF